MTKRFGFRTGIFRQWPAERTAAELAALGYGCLELCLENPDVRPETLDEARCAALRKTFDSIGISLASVSYHGDNEPADERLANQKHAIQAAKWLGAGVVVINAERSVDQRRQWAEHIVRFRMLCDLAEGAGVMLAVEPEPLLVIGSSRDMLDIINEVRSPRLAVNLDIGHAWITDDDVIASIRMLGSAIVHLHLEDIKGRVHRHLPFGEGDIDFAAIRGALEEIGYAGPYVADLFGLDEEPLVVADKALRGMRRFFG